MKAYTAILLSLLFGFAGLAISAPQTSTAPASPQVEAAAKDRWITISSGVRHNSSCRYFKNSKGRTATKDEGRACKLCGG